MPVLNKNIIIKMHHELVKELVAGTLLSYPPLIINLIPFDNSHIGILVPSITLLPSN